MRYLRLFLRYARLNLMSAAEYRASFLGAALGMLLNNSTFVFFWWVAFGYAGESIGGYSFDDVMFIWAASSTAYGLAHVFFDGVRGLSRTIVQGELDIFLLQPKPPLLSLACSKTDFTSWGDLLYGFVLMALTGQNGAAWLWFLLGALGGALLIASFETMAHCFTFYVGDASQPAAMASEFLINACLYPAGMYPWIIRVIMATVLPALFVVHVPLWLARGASLWWAALWLAFCLFFLYLAHVVFRRALRRYESGNLLSARL